MKSGLLWAMGLVGVLSGCATPVPVDYANLCNKANDGKTVEVTGYLANTGSSMCSKSGNGPMRCPIPFVAAPGPATEKSINANIERGGGSSEVENVEGAGLKIRDTKGDFVERTQKVKLTARVSVFDLPPSQIKSAGCSLNVKKIEKQ